MTMYVLLTGRNNQKPLQSFFSRDLALKELRILNSFMRTKVVMQEIRV
jgi:hypothetical protein